MGSMRIRERLKELEKTTTHYDQLIKEFIRNDLTAFQRLYLKDRDIKNVILMGDFLTDTIFQEELEDHIITSEEFTKSYEKTIYKTEHALAEEMDIDPEYASLVILSLIHIALCIFDDCNCAVKFVKFQVMIDCHGFAGLDMVKDKTFVKCSNV